MYFNSGGFWARSNINKEKKPVQHSQNQKFFNRLKISFLGLLAAFTEERNFRIQFLIAVMVVVLMIALGLNPIEESILLLTIFAVLSLELINSQIEKFLDLIQPEHHPRVKIIKDFSAGAVLLSSLGSIIIGALIFFPHISNLNKIEYYNIKIFNLINAFAGSNTVLDNLGVFFADYFPYFLGALLLYFLIWPRKDKKKNAVMVCVSVVSALISRLVIKTAIVFFYAAPRPDVVLGYVHRLIPMAPYDNFQSFPSGHALFFFAISMAVYFYNKKLGTFFFVSSVLIGIARVYVGVHWPIDIVAGAILGIISACLVQAIYNFFVVK